ncbi:GPI mannosyltransferase 2 [Auriculariales sp. MPI-PUGE-AT-0066]|nr:GPI mannosyltransferase 2 [Auriculariales sp. MPI-PUGE-AT-0066]
MTQNSYSKVITFDLLQRTAFATVLSVLSFLPLFDASPLVSDTRVPSSLPVLQRWDTFHFSGIALRGYAYEQTWAFLPGVPILLRAIGTLVTSNPNPTRLAVYGALAAALSSNVAVLYQLTSELTGLPAVSTLTAALSLLSASPATMFFAAYTEPFFTLLAYKGMLFCVRKQYLAGSVAFTIAAAFRSNGMVLGGFIAWPTIVEPILETMSLYPLFTFKSIGMGLLSLLPTVPFFAHQYRGYMAFCTNDSPPDWCSSRLPFVYSHVQQTYWVNGFLSYWTPDQIPNFLLAAPIYALLLVGCYVHLRCRLTQSASDRFFRSKNLTPHALHAAFLTLTLLLNANVQIMLRLAASMPFLYWSAAWLWLEHPVWARRWVIWSCCWAGLSLVLWSAFLPPA